VNFKIIRNDGLSDHLTTYTFFSYEEAYDLLEKELGPLCCSDTDYDNGISYEIIKI